MQAICGLIRNWAYPRYSLFVFSFLYFVILGVMVMVFNATFNNISVTLWRSVLLVEEIGVPGENHQQVANH